MTQDTPEVSIKIPWSATAPETPSSSGCRTEKSNEPQQFYKSINMVKDDEATIGNNEFVFTLKVSGQLGIFYNQENEISANNSVVSANLIFNYIPTWYRGLLCEVLLLARGSSVETSHCYPLADVASKSLFVGLYYLQFNCTFVGSRRPLLSNWQAIIASCSFRIRGHLKFIR